MTLKTRKEYREHRKLRGLCYNCGCRPPSDGRSSCEICLGYTRQWRLQKIQAGICGACAVRPLVKGKTRCAICIKAHGKRALKWRKSHPENVRVEQRRVKAALMKIYGGQCVACGEQDLAALTIDHVFNDGHKRRAEGKDKSSVLYRRLRRKGCPDKSYQILCGSCQLRKTIYGADFTKWPQKKTEYSQEAEWTLSEKEEVNNG